MLPRTGAMPETVRPEETGFLYEPNEPSVLAETVAGIWQRGAPTRQQRESASLHAGGFTWRRAGEAFLSAVDAAPRASLALQSGRLRRYLQRVRRRARGPVPGDAAP